MVCGHAFHSGWFEAVLWAVFCLYTPESAHIQYALRHHDRIEIDTSISVIVVSPTTWEAHNVYFAVSMNTLFNKESSCW